MTDLEFLRAEQAKRALARKDYAWYLRYIHGKSWKDTRLSGFLAGRLQQFAESETGNAYDVLLIETSPQHGKSLTVTESFPSWYLGRHPTRRVIEASYWLLSMVLPKPETTFPVKKNSSFS